MAVALLYDELFLNHRDPVYSHPECPERLIAVQGALQRADMRSRTVHRAPRPATREEITAVHDAAYFDRVQRDVPEQEGHLDPDTFYSAGSWDAALHAAGGAVDLAVDVLRGTDELRSGFALVRPPGHHAEANRAMGFCIFNNVAVAAQAALAAGARRVAILDWDVHHGNGTQHAFEKRNDVLYVSTHRYPFYPGTGSHREIGRGDGEGFTVNVPLPGGCADAEFIAAFDRVICPVIAQYAPDLLLLSAGFDAHARDPLGGMGVTDAGYRVLSRKVRQVAEQACGGKMVGLLEGGYNVEALGRAVVGLLDEWLADDLGDPEEIQPSDHPQIGKLLDEVCRALAPHWSL
jgi:acetoin utilization deacetylase AcuC-like enzyme